MRALRGGGPLLERLGRVRALVLDVDGVLTDGSLYYGIQGEALKRFHARDGLGLRLLGEAGVVVALMTAEETDIVRRRAEKLGIRHVFTGVGDKGRAFREFLGACGIEAAEAAYMGDDLLDVPALEAAGFPVVVADASPEARRAARLVTERPGGQGAVREVCDAILAARSRAPAAAGDRTRPGTSSRRRRRRPGRGS